MSQYEPLYDSFSHGGHGGYVPTPRMSVSASVYQSLICYKNL